VEGEQGGTGYDCRHDRQETPGQPELRQKAMTLFRVRKRRAVRPDESAQSDARLQELKRSKDIPGLINLLRRSRPPEKHRVHQALQELAGKDFGPKARLWKRWLKSNRPEQPASGKLKWIAYLIGVLHAVFVAELLRRLSKRVLG
jgi:hypothetical protein